MSQHQNGATERPNLRALPKLPDAKTKGEGAQIERDGAGAPFGETKRDGLSVPLERRGGARENAGRKPKALRYAAELADAEGKIVAALPDVIDGLIRAANGGDVAAARYLLDRVWGRVPEAAAPVAEDVSEPLNEDEWEARDAEGAKMRALREGLF